MLRFNSPVQFPINWVRNPAGLINRNFASGVSINQSIVFLGDELRDMGAANAILYSNFENIDNDMRRLKKGHSEGVGLRFNYEKADIFMGCDKWAALPQNIYALYLTLRNPNLIAEHGSASLIKLLNCFNQAEKRTYVDAKGKLQAEWLDYLGLGETATLNDANAVYRSRAKLLQYDEEAMIELNQMIEQARKYFKG